jgi:hypothetical protein
MMMMMMWCVYGDAPAAEEIAQLSTLRSLREVCVVWDSYQLGDDAATVKGIAAAFALLPLKALTLRHAGMSAALMQQLGCLQGLTALKLEGIVDKNGVRWRHLPESTRTLASQDCATVAQLAAALQQLAALRYLRLYTEQDYTDKESAAALQASDNDGVVALLQAIDGLKHLSGVSVGLDVCAAIEQLHMQQLVPNLLARGCRANVLRAGMPGMYGRNDVIRICIAAAASGFDDDEVDDIANV